MRLTRVWHRVTRELGTYCVGAGLVCLGLAGGSACGGNTPVPLGALRINEVMAANDGAYIDEVGQTDDWIELRNDGAETIWLDDFLITDDTGEQVALPHRELGPGERIVLWADDDESQSELHLPFKLSASGDELVIRDVNGHVSDQLVVPPLADNDSFARIPETEDEYVVCRYATPGRDNGLSCGPLPPPDLEDNITFDPFVWPAVLPHAPAELSINELALKPASFIEITNVSDSAVTLAAFSLRIATHKPGLPWPDANTGSVVGLGNETLAPGASRAIAIDAAVVAALEADPLFEGVVTLFRTGDNALIDRVDFMSWPAEASLARQPNGVGQHVFCQATTPGADNAACDPLASRPLAHRDRHLYTPGDFDALAAGGTDLGISGVKVVIDRQAGNVVHLLGTERWDLHYTFVREEIDHEPHLDRCVAGDARTFQAGWNAFSEAQYDETTDSRRYFLATLDRYTGGQHTLHFSPGDRINAQQMRDAYFFTTAHVNDPTRWFLHPQSAAQANKMREVDGELPIMSMNAPFRGQTVQPLTRAVGFGVLRFVPVAELDATVLGPEVIVVTDDVPNDIALVGGLITEAFQTPLAHVNLLSRNRNTPNLALRNARSDARLQPLFDTLVRLEVTASGFEIRAADNDEAQAFWESMRPTGPRIAPRLDRSVRGVQMLSQHNLSSLPALGAKAAQLAELAKVLGYRLRYKNDAGEVVSDTNCTGLVPTPPNAFAIPIVHSIEHMRQSGALTIFEREQDALRDPTRRTGVLDRMRAAILSHPVDPVLLAQVHAHIDTHFGDARVRMRSSSNTEDLPEFNGAGLYTSLSVAIGDPERPIEGGMRTVWSSLWTRRAYDERELGNIDQSKVAIAILVHEAFPSERANGVGISRNIIDPLRGDERYFNFQVGEAAVTNPAPGVTTEQLIHTPWAPGREGVAELTYRGHSSLTDGPVMSIEEVRQVSCVLRAIHNHFRKILDPQFENPWFAMDIEMKLLGPERELMVKQARPYSFGSAEIPADCREF